MSKGTRRRNKIYIVDDDISVLKGISRLLDAHGLETVRFSSAQAFLAAAPSEGTLLLDIRMPGMGGFELLEALAGQGRHFHVVLMTAYDEPAYKERARQYGVAGYLIKPINGQDLLESLGIPTGL